MLGRFDGRYELLERLGTGESATVCRLSLAFAWNLVDLTPQSKMVNESPHQHPQK